MKGTIYCHSKKINFVFSKHHKKERPYGRLFQDDCVPRMCTICNLQISTPYCLRFPLSHLSFGSLQIVHKTGFDKQTIPKPSDSMIHSLPKHLRRLQRNTT